MTSRALTPPFVREGPSVRSMLGWTLFALFALLIVPVVRYGARPITMACAAMLTCIICEFFVNLLTAGKLGLTDPSPLVTGMVCTMLMPLNAPLWLPCAAGAFAILIAKAPFGPFGRTPFNPAAAGTAFVSLCWPGLMFTYFDPAQPYSLPAFGTCTFLSGESAAAVLKEGLKPDILPLNMLWGESAGPLTTGIALVIAAGGILLVLTRSAHWEPMVFFLGTAALLASLFPRIACSPLTSVKYELLSGSVFFCAVFMASNPVSAPRTRVGRCVYGALAGAFVMLFRYFGQFEQGASFAILAADAASPLISAAIARLRGWEGPVHE
jgi:electron transport complex protein RnfD